MPENLLQLGAVAIIFLFAIKEFFAYIKSRNGINYADKLSSAGNDINNLVLKELQKMNNNHLHGLEETINRGNSEIIKTINDGNSKIIEVLWEIKSKK